MEAARLALAPEDRAFRPGIQVRGMPKEWIRYVPQEVVVEGIDLPTDD